LLSKIYLHYVLDLRFERRFRKTSFREHARRFHRRLLGRVKLQYG
jgi:hypothetical protein